MTICERCGKSFKNINRHKICPAKNFKRMKRLSSPITLKQTIEDYFEGGDQNPSVLLSCNIISERFNTNDYILVKLPPLAHFRDDIAIPEIKIYDGQKEITYKRCDNAQTQKKVQV